MPAPHSGAVSVVGGISGEGGRRDLGAAPPLLWLEPALCSWALADWSPPALGSGEGVAGRSGEVSVGDGPSGCLQSWWCSWAATSRRSLGLFKKKGEWVWLGA